MPVPGLSTPSGRGPRVDGIARLDYTANISAQTVARGRSTTVALLVSDIADGYFSPMAAALSGMRLPRR